MTHSNMPPDAEIEPNTEKTPEHSDNAAESATTPEIMQGVEKEILGQFAGTPGEPLAEVDESLTEVARTRTENQ